MKPELVILEGERGVRKRIDLARILRPDDLRLWRLNKYFTGEDIKYLEENYPELMGAWGTIAVTAGKVVRGIGKKIFGGIARRIRERRERRKAKSNQAAIQTAQNRKKQEQIKRQVQAAAVQMEYQAHQEAAQAAQKSNMIMIVSAVGILALFLLSQGKK